MRTSSNPALTRSPAFTGKGGPQAADPLEQAYFGPSATSRETGRMTVDDVVGRTALLLAVAFGTGALTWALDLGALAFPAALVGFGLAMFIIFKQVTNPVPIIAYAAVEGVFLGGISQFFNAQYPGIVVQAVVGTAGVTAVMLGLYASGRIRVTPQFTKMVIGATIGFVVLIMVNLVAGIFTSGGLGLRQGPLGIVVGIVAIGLAALNLVLDFDMVEKGARAGIPTRYGWFAAFGIMITLVWLYVEMLRLLSILRS
ncbi:MAG: Bax inhibitor-1/YccA family protein [Actinomycetota bacterium]|nr:Bax inhibitor-1/YccA family protein [Actinomycetota bacterium]MDQ6948381.1 Bax inhibitor-1/YccA family protein [Actinomycetota bacterium]